MRIEGTSTTGTAGTGGSGGAGTQRWRSMDGPSSTGGTAASGAVTPSGPDMKDTLRQLIRQILPVVDTLKQTTAADRTLVRNALLALLRKLGDPGPEVATAPPPAASAPPPAASAPPPAASAPPPAASAPPPAASAPPPAASAPPPAESGPPPAAADVPAGSGSTSTSAGPTLEQAVQMLLNGVDTLGLPTAQSTTVKQAIVQAVQKLAAAAV